jgi:hypothetical protein
VVSGRNFGKKGEIAERLVHGKNLVLYGLLYLDLCFLKFVKI